MSSLAFLLACSTPSANKNAASDSRKSGRSIASLDNNGEVRDDGFDPNLESYYGGSAEGEQNANNAVAEVIRKFIDSQKQARQQVLKSEGPDAPQAQRIFKDLPKPDYATRDVHRKTNGCFKAEFDIASNLTQSLNTQIAEYQAQASPLDKPLSPVLSTDDLGVFAPGAVYDAIVRVSNGHPSNRPDKMADARGFAVKILPKGSLNERAVTEMSAEDLNLATKLDILSINFPTFFVNDPLKYAKLNQVALNSATDFNNKVVGTAGEFWSIFGGSDLTSMERRLALWVNGSVIYSPLYQEYFSMVPSRLGTEGTTRAVKYSWIPVSCSPDADARFAQEKKIQWSDWTNDHTYAFPPHMPSIISNPPTPYAAANFPDDFLREHIVERLSSGDFCFNLYFQLYRDPSSTNIEDSTDFWPRTESEKLWWTEQVVPDLLAWSVNLHNTESRADYLERFARKRIAPTVLAGKLRLRHLTAQEVVSAKGNNKTCEDLSFNPWNGDISHHKPLGIVSRLKRKVYNASRRERHELNGINDKPAERP